MMRDPPPLCSAYPVSDNDYNNWKAVIQGPLGTPYEGGIFELTIKIPEEYPTKPPVFTMITKIYHMNISNSGGICLDSITSNWVPTCSIAGALVSIIALLTDPNPSSPNG